MNIVGGTVDICNCEDDERCVISGELARRECVEGKKVIIFIYLKQISLA